MGFLDNMATRLTRLVLRGARLELRRINRTLELQTDSFRQAHGLPALFAPQDPYQTAVVEAPKLEDRMSALDGRWQAVYALQELCREAGIMPVPEGEALVVVAREHGWLDSGMQLTTMPESFATTMVDPMERF